MNAQDDKTLGDTVNNYAIALRQTLRRKLAPAGVVRGRGLVNSGAKT